MSEDTPSALQERIDAIEEAFEYMLGYAAQGREREEADEDEGIRTFLANAAEALDGLQGVAEERVSDLDLDKEQWAAFLGILGEDAAKALALIGFVQAQPILSSELIDNLNASSHIRALLTDIFLFDSALGAGAKA
ncbi:MAG: hypothetical protein HQ503_13405 [Rhodospirillales bacterium]|nr:hypothetical protein [Rhodospirillales bacterium]